MLPAPDQDRDDLDVEYVRDHLRAMPKGLSRGEFYAGYRREVDEAWRRYPQ